jgi:hypothetical protein
MKNRFYKNCCMPAVLALLLTAGKVLGQQFDCSVTYSVFKIDFGNDESPVDMQLAYVRKFYSPISGPCPDDGEYTFTSAVKNCFNGNWYNIPKDHTPGSNRGRMMLVNAARQPSAFFTYLVTGLKDNAHYIYSAWFLNVCRPHAECTSTLPQIHALITDKGKILASARSGDIDKLGPGGWQQIRGEFTLPAGTTSCLIFMETAADGGCGNDFAMDDIEVKMCKIIEPPVKSIAVNKPAVAPPAKTVQPKPLVKTASVKPEPLQPSLKKSEAVIKNEPLQKTVQRPAVINPANSKLLPVVLQTRANIVAKQMETAAEELEINLYDNGEIDGDTVSIYHNNAPLLLHAGLSAKPLSFKITVSEQTPHHELVMVADNLGSIPPNTSVMIVTSKSNRWQISLSASDKQNAKVVIDLKKE